MRVASIGAMFDEAATLTYSRAPARLIGDRYELYSEIGQGGFGVVYEAFDTRLLRLVAVKLPRPGAFNARTLSRFALEVECSSRVQHRNVCRVLDAGYVEDGRPFVVMERLVGETVHTTLKRGTTFTPERAIDITLDLLGGLSAIHALGVVHRDVKPANVFLVARPGIDRPLVKLIDFGSCHGKDGRETALTSDGHCIGTPSYMTPEQIAGTRRFGPELDVYAAAVVLYEMLAGRPAYEGDLRQVVFAILQKPFPRLRVVRPELIALDAILARATAREATHRYSCTSELARDLELARLRDDELPTRVRSRS